MSKKTLIVLIILALIVLITLSVLIIFLLRKTKKPEVVPPLKPQEIVQVGSITPLAENNLVLFPHLSQDGKSVIFVDGKVSGFKEISLEQKTEKSWVVADLPLVTRVEWSADHSKVFLRTRNEENNFESFIYDLSKSELKELDSKIVNAIWYSDNKTLLYHYLDEGQKISELNKVNYDGKNRQKIADWDVWTTDFGWLDEQKIAIATIPSDPNPTQIFEMNLSSGEKKPLTEVEAVSFRTNGVGQIIYQVFKSQKEKPVLKLLDYKNGKKYDLQLSTEMDKVTWSADNKTVIAAVSSDAGIDDFYQFSPEDNKIKKLEYKTEDLKLSAVDLMAAPNQKDIYFTSNNLLYKLTLP